jgi:hypothetical protein
VNGICPTFGKITYFETDEVYEGEIDKDFMRHGFGKLIFKNGNTYEG